MTVVELLQQSSAELKHAGIDSAWLDAELLLAHVLKKDRAWLLTHPEYRPHAHERKRYALFIQKRSRHIPLAYLTGVKEFYGHPFRVTPSVLIPRPETEALVELIIAQLKKLPTGSLVADIGTGSGCIAITLARLLPSLRFIATDTSTAALLLARANAKQFDVATRICFCKDAMFSAIRTPGLRAMIANLPYLSERAFQCAKPELTFEPKTALCSGPRGDETIRALLENLASKIPKTLECVALEVHQRHANALAKFAAQQLPMMRWSIHPCASQSPSFLLGIRH